MRRIEKIEDMSVGQLYMYIENYNDRLKRGYCCKLTRDRVTFDRRDSVLNDTINMTLGGFDGSIYEYNAGIFYKYQKLLEQQKKEREDLLNDKPVIVESDKWYKRFLRRKKKNV